MAKLDDLLAANPEAKAEYDRTMKAQADAAATADAEKNKRPATRAELKEIVPATMKDREALIVTAIPYQVNKKTLQEKIAELVHEKKIEGIADLRDESDRTGMRIVIELKRGDGELLHINCTVTPLRLLRQKL